MASVAFVAACDTGARGQYLQVAFCVKKIWYKAQQCDLCQQQWGIRLGACNKQRGIERVKFVLLEFVLYMIFKSGKNGANLLTSCRNCTCLTILPSSFRTWVVTLRLRHRGRVTLSQLSDHQQEDGRLRISHQSCHVFRQQNLSVNKG